MAMSSRPTTARTHRTSSEICRDPFDSARLALDEVVGAW
jgi:hypothetical protein